MSVASVPEVGEVHSDHVADQHEVKQEDVVEGGVLNGVLLSFFVYT